MTLPVDINDSPNYTSDEHADHHNDLHAEYNTPTHTHSGSTVAARFAVGDASGDYSVTSGTFVDLDATDFALTIPAAVGDRLELRFDCVASHSSTGKVGRFTFMVNGTDLALPSLGTGMLTCDVAAAQYMLNMAWWRTVVSGDISGGNVTVKVRVNTDASTLSVKNNTRVPVFSVKNWGA